MSWYDKMVAAGRSKSLTTGNVRCGVAAVHEVLGSLALETPVNCHSELMEDSLRNIEPVQLGVEQMCQASVKLSSITDESCQPELEPGHTGHRVNDYGRNVVIDFVPSVSSLAFSAPPKSEQQTYCTLVSSVRPLAP